MPYRNYAQLSIPQLLTLTRLLFWPISLLSNTHLLHHKRICRVHLFLSPKTIQRSTSHRSRNSLFFVLCSISQSINPQLTHCLQTSSCENAHLWSHHLCHTYLTCPFRQGYSLQCGNRPLLCLCLKTVGKRKIRRIIVQFRCYQLLAKPLIKYRPLTFCDTWWSESLSRPISSGSCLKSQQHCNYSAFRNFFPKFCLILKEWFLTRFPPNFQERFLMSSASPEFVFWIQR